jgi:hypothetical protein
MNNDDTLIVEYECGCKWFEISTNNFGPMKICIDHKIQIANKAIKLHNKI